MNHARDHVFAVFLFTSLAACADPGAPIDQSMAGAAQGTQLGGSSSVSGPAAGAAGTLPSVGGSSSDLGGTSSGGSAAGGSAGTPSSGAGSGGLSGAGGGAGAGDGVSENPGLVPEQGALFGAFVQTDSASSYGNLAPAEAQLGRKLAINHRFFRWEDDWLSGIAGDTADGRIPLVSWEPFSATLDAIIAGGEDDLIDSRAAAAKSSGVPIFMRWAHEMNGDWYPWGGANNGGAGAGPQKYIAAWRHLHDRFQAAGARNVVWVWCFNVGSSPNEAWNEPSAYYPGDSYVDWVAFDGYNWGTTQSWSTWRSFSSFASAAYEQSVGYGKPIMVPETGVTELGGDKPAWIKDLQSTLKSSFPLIKALVYFDTIDTANKVDWTMNSSAAALQAFAGLAGDPYFNP